MRTWFDMVAVNKVIYDQKQAAPLAGELLVSWANIFTGRQRIVQLYYSGHLMRDEAGISVTSFL